MSEIDSITTPILYRRTRPVSDETFKRFVRTLPCCVCGARRWIEAAHFGPHGLGQKASDRQTLPLCRKHHRTGDDSYHKLGPVKFATLHHLDIARLIHLLNTVFDQTVQRERS